MKLSEPNAAEQRISHEMHISRDEITDETRELPGEVRRYLVITPARARVRSPSHEPARPLVPRDLATILNLDRCTCLSHCPTIPGPYSYPNPAPNQAALPVLMASGGEDPGQDQGQEPPSPAAAQAAWPLAILDH